MEKGRYLVEAHLREGRSVAALARIHGVHPSWIYRLLARYRELGEEGLAAPLEAPAPLAHSDRRGGRGRDRPPAQAADRRGTGRRGRDHLVPPFEAPRDRPVTEHHHAGPAP